MLRSLKERWFCCWMSSKNCELSPIMRAAYTDDLLCLTSVPAPTLERSIEQPIHAPSLPSSDVELEIIKYTPATSKQTGTDSPPAHQCPGYSLPIPKGESPYLLYPFGLHAKEHLPWSPEPREMTMQLRALACERLVAAANQPCYGCRKLELSPVVRGIIDRMKNGTHINTTHAYLGIRDLVLANKAKEKQNQTLRFHSLNQTRAITRRDVSLSNQKRLIVAIANEDVPRVARVIHVALAKKRGVLGILEKVVEAAKGVYRAKKFDEKDRDLGRLLWRIGGDRMGHVASRVLGLPSVSTLRKESAHESVEPSAGVPTRETVAKNTMAALSGIMEVLKRSTVNHAVLMFDELAVEKRIRWNPRTNEILGLCREHGPKVALEFGNVGDVEEMFKAIDDGDVHFASEVST